MPESLEERVAYLEGRVSDQAQAQNELREMVVHLDQKVDRFREELGARISGLEESMNTRIAALDQKVDRFREELAARITNLEGSVNDRINGLEQSMNERFNAVDDRFGVVDERVQAVNDRIDALDEKVSRQFVWLVGIQITVLVAVVSALIAALLR